MRTFSGTGEAETLEGTHWQRCVIIGFDSTGNARTCNNSITYLSTRDKRAGACSADIARIEAEE